jgi:hypothetical protein
MEETLYVMGNGFDLHHGIASKYSDFKTYLAKYDRDLLYALEHLYDCKDIWGDFEQNLLTISRMQNYSFPKIARETWSMNLPKTYVNVFTNGSEHSLCPQAMNSESSNSTLTPCSYPSIILIL